MDIYLILLGGGLIKDRGKWRTTNFKEAGDNFGVLGDRLRVVAAACLYKKNPKIKIIASGGKGQLSGIKDAPTVSEVLLRELIELGVNAKNIIKDKKSNNTYQQLKNSISLTNKLKPSEIWIISNRYHLPRVRASLDIIIKPGSSPQLISAEEILIADDPKTWKKNIEKAYSAPEMKKRIKLEKRGIKDIKEGKYKLEP